MKKRLLIIFSCVLASSLVYKTTKAQQGGEARQIDLGTITGNFETTAQYYREDSLIGAQDFPSDLGANSYLNLNYTRGNFYAGMRFESYEPVLQGFPGFSGSGIGYRYAGFRRDGIDVTVGNFYEQFGTGLIFRSYEERSLGVDNVMDGIRVKYQGIKGVNLIGFVARQRKTFTNANVYGDGIVRGFDAEISINDLFEQFKESKTRLTIGGSFVSKFQEDNPSTLFQEPENVGAYAGRFTLNRGGFLIMGEYAYKVNDPSADNGFIYKDGKGLFLSASYSRKGFGAAISGKAIDNMGFRSDRTGTVNELTLSFLPALTRQHTYNLAATLYPYASQPNGEVAFQGDIFYKIKKGTLLGGKYGTKVAINYSTVVAPDSTLLNDAIVDPNDPNYDPNSKLLGWETELFGYDERTFFNDFNIEISKKLSKKVRVVGSYVNLVFNNDVLKLSSFDKGTFYTNIAILDVTYKIKKKHTLRIEGQHMWMNETLHLVDDASSEFLNANPGEYVLSEKDQGDWAAGIIEYTFSPHWIVSVIDQFNYGNENPDRQIHYVTGSVVYVNKGTRIMMSYGRQRAGVFCVGGVCRNVPAANGATLTITSTF